MNLTLLPAHLAARLDFAIRLARQCGELALKEATQLQISAKKKNNQESANFD